MESARSSKAVIATNGDKTIHYATIGEAASAHGLTRCQIMNRIKKGKSYNGYTFSFEQKPVPWGATHDWGPQLPYIKALAGLTTKHLYGNIAREAREYVYDWLIDKALKTKYPWGAQKLFKMYAKYALVNYWIEYHKLHTDNLDDEEWSCIIDERKTGVLDKLPVHLISLANLLLKMKDKAYIIKKLKITEEQYNNLKNELGEWLLDNY